MADTQARDGADFQSLLSTRVRVPLCVFALFYIATCLAGSLPLSSMAGGPSDDSLRRSVEEAERREAEEEALRKTWQDREANLVAEIKAARAHLELIQKNRIRAQDGAYGGVKRSEWTRRFEEAQETVASATRELREFYEEARRADVPPGWLNEDLGSSSDK